MATTHAILVQSRVAAANIDPLNRSVISGSDVDNGNIFLCSSQSSTAGQTEVWNISPVTTAYNNVWMAYSPELVLTDGRYRLGDPDPRNFYNNAGKVFDAFKPQPGDVLVLSASALAGTAKSAYANSGSTLQLVWGGATSSSSLSLKYLKTEYLSLATGEINNQRVTAYKFEVLSN